MIVLHSSYPKSSLVNGGTVLNSNMVVLRSPVGVQSLVLSPSFRTSIWLENPPLICYYNKHFCMGAEIGKSKTIQYFIRCHNYLNRREEKGNGLITIFHGQ